MEEREYSKFAFIFLIIVANRLKEASTPSILQHDVSKLPWCLDRMQLRSRCSRSSITSFVLFGAFFICFDFL